MHIELVKGKRKWFYRVVSSRNGQVILTSQKYYSKWNAKRACKRLAEVNNMKVVLK